MPVKYQSILVFFLVSLFVCVALPVSAGVDLSVGGGYLKGKTQYRIGGRAVYADGSTTQIHFPLSELRFPLDSYVIKGQVDIDFAKKWALMLSAETNLTDDSGKMEDSDWGVWEGSPINRLDIFSKSDTEMDMYAVEGKLTYELYSAYYGQNALRPETGNSDINFTYTVGIGYKYQNYDFEVYDLDQWYPSSPTTPHDIVAGLVLKYDAEYQLPYLEVGMKMDVYDRFALGLDVGYAPLIAFKDKDQHLLRDKVNVADHGWEGDAFMGRLSMRYNISRRWYVNADYEVMQLTSEGTAKSYLGGVWNHTIDHEITSRQHRAYLMLGCSF